MEAVSGSMGTEARPAARLIVVVTLSGSRQEYFLSKRLISRTHRSTARLRRSLASDWKRSSQGQPIALNW